jgi:protein O-GlcNAc transferase
MNIGPVVTIGIPFYNEEKYIIETLDSVARQSYKNLRILVADNCSTDASFSLVERYSVNDSRIKIFRHPKNMGAAYNFKFVLDNAVSEYFMWLGGHDIISSDYIKNAVEMLQTNETVVLCYPEAVYIDSNGNTEENIAENYDTTGLNQEQRILKVAQNFNNGYVIHGVFRLGVLKMVPFEDVIGPDFLMVVLVNLYGSIGKIQYVGFQRRVIRNETANEQNKRHLEQGVYSAKSKRPFDYFFIILCKHLFRSKAMAVTTKLGLILKLKKVFEQRFNVKSRSLIGALYHYLIQKIKHGEMIGSN